jgi:hypothetical protein
MSDLQIGWDDLPDEVRYAVEAGKKIEAIKLLRESRGIGLKEAKDALDPLFDAHAPKGARGGCGGALFALVTFGTALAHGAHVFLA